MLDQVYDLRHAGKYAEAGEVNLQRAEAFRSNELIYIDDCCDAVKDMLEGEKPERALEIARMALKVISPTSWFPEDKSCQELFELVGDFYARGYGEAAEQFAEDINAQLRKQKLPERFARHRGTLPSECPNCGGILPQTLSDVSVKCPFCGLVVRSEVKA